jgi:hypothetical protein
VARAKEAGVYVEPKQMFQHQTIAELAKVARQEKTEDSEQGPISGTVPLTPIQHYFFSLNLQDWEHFNQAILLTVKEYVPTEKWRVITQKLLEHHDALRLRFETAKKMLVV